MRASARKSRHSPCLAAGGISPGPPCGSGCRVEPSRSLDLKQHRQLGRRRCRPLESGIWTSDKPYRRSLSARSRPIWGRIRAWALARAEPGPAAGVSSHRRWERPGSGGTFKRTALPSVGVCPSWQTDDVNPSDKSKSEYRKMRAAFEENDWPVPSPQKFHHWTLARQVDHLVTAREAEPDLGFMARMLALCSLPRTNPGRRKEYVRRNGPYTLVMSAGGLNKLPYGNLPRLLLAWVSTEAVRTRRRTLVLGDSLSEFMRRLDIYSDSGGSRGMRTRLRNQMHRLFNVSIQLLYEDDRHSASMSSFVADRTDFWWDPKRPDDPVLWDSTIRLGRASSRRSSATLCRWT